MTEVRGDFIDGRFLDPKGEPLVSVNPAKDGEEVFATRCDVERVGAGCAAAAAAQPSWAQLSRTERTRTLLGFSGALREHIDPIADAIVLETGKIRAEARAEVQAALTYFQLVHDQVEGELLEGPVPDMPDGALYHHALGVVGVIGSFQAPLRRCHAHIVPALLVGNAVVVKPSEVAPLTMLRYFEAVAEAGFPPGVLNLVQGAKEAGASLVMNPQVRGVCFTGSVPTARQIARNALNRTKLLLSIETNGRNTAVVLDDADLRQTVHELVLGGNLTTGQRFTSTSRILVHRSRVDELLEALREVVPKLVFGDPEDPASFAGPMATEIGRTRFETALSRARASDAKVIVEGGRLSGGYFVRGSVHMLPDHSHHIRGYTDVGPVGPDLCVESIDSFRDALAVLENSPLSVANTVFTAERYRFENLLRQGHCGSLNWNRSTTAVSARISLGGGAHAGSYRLAGMHAPRNLTYPVATVEQMPGVLRPHSALADLLPGSDLDVLEQRHVREEADEAEIASSPAPRPMGWNRPTGGRLPYSEAWLQRLYAGGRAVQEKRPIVVDHYRSSGPWIVSVDEDPLALLDAISQTSTHSAGFAADEVLAGYFDGVFGDSICRASVADPSGGTEADEYRRLLKPRLGPKLQEITFTSSGAEANEKAIALCRLEAPEGANRLLAFEGSFHGRSLLALHLTWSKTKRAPFEISGHEAIFAPFPAWSRPSRKEPLEPMEFREIIARGEIEQLLATCPADNWLLRSELESLAYVHAALANGDVFACIVEPMQSEGGDRRGTARFFRGLRLLTRFHDVPLIFDEVQTGFGVSGTFLWHSQFGLVDAAGAPDEPDAVTMAKRAQVGIVASRFADPEPTPPHTASLVRGRLYVQTLGTGNDAHRVEQWVRPRLEAIGHRFPELMQIPRVTGFTFAFDLPSPAHLRAYLGQCFWRGAIVFGAGTRTVRYRLNRSFGDHELELLMMTIRQSLSWLDANPGQSPPQWEDLHPAGDTGNRRMATRVRRIEPGKVDAWFPRIVELTANTREAANTGSEDRIRSSFDPLGIVLVAEVETENGWELAGCALAGPIESHADISGPAGDPNLGFYNTIYSYALFVHSTFRGFGLGKMLKSEQVRTARTMVNSEGRQRYRFLTGRNDVDQVVSTTHVNRQLGAYIVEVLEGQAEGYGDDAIYYRIPLTGMHPNQNDTTITASGGVTSLSDGIAAPFGNGPVSLRQAEARGLLFGPTVNKITILNYVTPTIVRAFEWISAFAPNLRHLYLTNSRAEVADKALRLLRWHRPLSRVVIGLEDGYVGHTTAAARSISDPALHRQGPPIFDWPRLPHPAIVGSKATIAAIRKAMTDAGGPDAVIGLVLEYCQERSGCVIPASFWPMLAELRAQTGLPVALFETSTAVYRSGLGPFASSDLRFLPDLLCWFGGGQVGFIHTNDQHWVNTPFAMASTWDGDELSLVRVVHHLRTARQLDLRPANQALRNALIPAQNAGLTVRGVGLYRVIETDKAPLLRVGLAESGLDVTMVGENRLIIAPPLDRAEELAARLGDALTKLLG